LDTALSSKGDSILLAWLPFLLWEAAAKFHSFLRKDGFASVEGCVPFALTKKPRREAGVFSSISAAQRPPKKRSINGPE
jgi:hypothetical protein